MYIQRNALVEMLPLESVKTGIMKKKESHNVAIDTKIPSEPSQETKPSSCP